MKLLQILGKSIIKLFWNFCNVIYCIYKFDYSFKLLLLLMIRFNVNLKKKLFDKLKNLNRFFSANISFHIKVYHSTEVETINF